MISKFDLCLVDWVMTDVCVSVCAFVFQPQQILVSRNFTDEIEFR